MIIVTLLRNLLLGNATKAGLVAAAVAVALLYHHSVIKQGEAIAVAKQKKADHAAINRGATAAQRSADPATRGVLDPYTRGAK